MTTLTEVKEIVDEAIDNAEKGVFKIPTWSFSMHRESFTAVSLVIFPADSIIRHPPLIFSVSTSMSFWFSAFASILPILPFGRLIMKLHLNMKEWLRMKEKQYIG